MKNEKKNKVKFGDVGRIVKRDSDMKDRFYSMLKGGFFVSEMAKDFGMTEDEMITIGYFLGFGTAHDEELSQYYFIRNRSEKEKITSEILSKINTLSNELSELKELVGMH